MCNFTSALAAVVTNKFLKLSLSTSWVFTGAFVLNQAYTTQGF
jgi:hypothetical protein